MHHKHPTIPQTTIPVPVPAARSTESEFRLGYSLASTTATPSVTPDGTPPGTEVNSPQEYDCTGNSLSNSPPQESILQHNGGSDSSTFHLNEEKVQQSIPHIPIRHLSRASEDLIKNANRLAADFTEQFFTNGLLADAKKFKQEYLEKELKKVADDPKKMAETQAALQKQLVIELEQLGDTYDHVMQEAIEVLAFSELKNEKQEWVGLHYPDRFYNIMYYVLARAKQIASHYDSEHYAQLRDLKNGSGCTPFGALREVNDKGTIKYKPISRTGDSRISKNDVLRIQMPLKRSIIIMPICYGTNKALSGKALKATLESYLKEGADVCIYVGTFGDVRIHKAERSDIGLGKLAEWLNGNINIVLDVLARNPKGIGAERIEVLYAHQNQILHLPIADKKHFIGLVDSKEFLQAKMDLYRYMLDNKDLWRSFLVNITQDCAQYLGAPKQYDASPKRESSNQQPASGDTLVPLIKMAQEAIANQIDSLLHKPDDNSLRLSLVRTIYHLRTINSKECNALGSRIFEAVLTKMFQASLRNPKINKLLAEFLRDLTEYVEEPELSVANSKPNKSSFFHRHVTPGNNGVSVKNGSPSLNAFSIGSKSIFTSPLPPQSGASSSVLPLPPLSIEDQDPSSKSTLVTTGFPSPHANN